MNKLITLQAHNNQEVTIPLSELLRLDDSIFKGVFPITPNTLRPLNPENLQSLVNSSPNAWPAIKVVDTSEGPVLLGGYHRVEARKLQALLSSMSSTGNYIGLEELTFKEQREAVSRYEKSNPKEATKALEGVSLPAILGNYASPLDVVLDTLVMNSDNGLQASKSVKALEYWNIVSQLPNPPMQKDVAEKFHINKATLNEYIKKDREAKKEQALEAPEEGSESEQEEVPVDVAKEAKALTNKLKKVLEGLDNMRGLDSDMYKALVKDYIVPEALASGLVIEVPVEAPVEAPKKGKGKGKKEAPLQSEQDPTVSTDDIQAPLSESKRTLVETMVQEMKETYN